VKCPLALLLAIQHNAFVSNSGPLGSAVLCIYKYSKCLLFARSKSAELCGRRPVSRRFFVRYVGSGTKSTRVIFRFGLWHNEDMLCVQDMFAESFICCLIGENASPLDVLWFGNSLVTLHLSLVSISGLNISDLCHTWLVLHALSLTHATTNVLL
jgi:hypothetical protein